MQSHFADATRWPRRRHRSCHLDDAAPRVAGPTRHEKRSAPLCEADISGLRYFRFLPEPTKVGGVPCFVSRTGFGGELGYELFCRPEHAADLWDVAVSRMNARPFGVGVSRELEGRGGARGARLRLRRHERTPYDLSFDRFVALGGWNFSVATHSSRWQPIPRGDLKTLRIEGDELPITA